VEVGESGGQRDFAGGLLLKSSYDVRLAAEAQRDDGIDRIGRKAGNLDRERVVFGTLGVVLLDR